MTTTLRDFRIAAAIELRDGLILTATGDGSTTTFIDATNLTDSPDAYASSHAIVISAVNAANVGKVVRVDASSPFTTSLTFASSLPAVTKTGDVLHLVNLGGYGFRPQMYDQVIATSLASAYPDFVIEAVTSGGPFDADTPMIAVPASLVAVYALELAEDEDNDEWRTVPQARKAGRWGDGWTLARPTRELRVDGSWRDTADGLNYRIRGYREHPAVSALSDPISIDLTWLMLDVKARLAARRGTDRQWQSWAVEWGRLAEQQRGRILTPREAGTVWL